MVAGGSTKRHLYWCMKNCSACPIQLRASIMNISKHYQVVAITEMHMRNCLLFPQNDHTNCYQDSPCRHPSYRPSKALLTDPHVIDVYEKALRDTMIYRHAEYYCRVHICDIIVFVISVVTHFGWNHSTTSCWHTSRSVSIFTWTHFKCEWILP